MSSLPSDEVAEDYKGSLEDLVTNDRYQISNLTLIAKENVEHAEAISRVLINHINRVCPLLPVSLSLSVHEPLGLVNQVTTMLTCLRHRRLASFQRCMCSTR